MSSRQCAGRLCFHSVASAGCAGIMLAVGQLTIILWRGLVLPDAGVMAGGACTGNGLWMLFGQVLWFRQVLPYTRGGWQVLPSCLVVRAGLAAQGLHHGRLCHVAGRWQVVPQHIWQCAVHCSLRAQVVRRAGVALWLVVPRCKFGVSAGLAAHEEWLAGLAKLLGARAGIAAQGLHNRRPCQVAGGWQVLPQHIWQFAIQCSLRARVVRHASVASWQVVPRCRLLAGCATTVNSCCLAGRAMWQVGGWFLPQCIRQLAIRCSLHARVLSHAEIASWPCCRGLAGCATSYGAICHCVYFGCAGCASHIVRAGCAGTWPPLAWLPLPRHQVAGFGRSCRTQGGWQILPS